MQPGQEGHQRPVPESRVMWKQWHVFLNNTILIFQNCAYGMQSNSLLMPWVTESEHFRATKRLGGNHQLQCLAWLHTGIALSLLQASDCQHSMKQCALAVDFINPVSLVLLCPFPARWETSLSMVHLVLLSCRTLLFTSESGKQITELVELPLKRWLDQDEISPAWEQEDFS